MNRIGPVAVVLLGASLALGCQPRLFATHKPIRVGLLHAQTGPLAEFERSLIDAEVLAIEEINAAGGVLGRPIEWFVADSRSDAASSAREARKLIREHKVRAIFGCYSSPARKLVASVIEEENNLLFYPIAYEGLEESPRIIYMGAAPNQQIIPTLKWAYDHLKARTFFLVGIDSVYSRGLNEIIKDLAGSIDCSVAGEQYVAFDGRGMDQVVEAIKRTKPDAVVNSVHGPGSEALSAKLRAAGISAAQCPVISYTMTEEEIQSAAPGDVDGDYVTASYFEVVNSPLNRDFVDRFRARFGHDRVTSDPIETAYVGVKIWAQAVEEAETDDPKYVLPLVCRQSYSAPEGVVSIDAVTHHAWRPSYIGKILSGGKIEIVWSSQQAIKPKLFPNTRSRAEWIAFLDNLRGEWDGRWQSLIDAQPKSIPLTTPAANPAAKPSSTTTPTGNSPS